MALEDRDRITDKLQETKWNEAMDALEANWLTKIEAA